MAQVQGEWGSSPQAKQNMSPHAHTGSQCASSPTLTALPQCGTLRERYANIMNS